jgi:hypothetical protein
VADDVGAGRGVVAVGGTFTLGASVSGPFCPHAVSNKPMVINAAIAKGA